MVQFCLLSLLLCTLFACVVSFRSPLATGKLLSSQLSALKFDPENFVKISATKPLGITLVENEEFGDLGVCIDEINAGSIKASGAAYKGLYLLTVNDIDVRTSSFDDIMDQLIDAPADKPLSLVFVDPRYVMKGPAVITVVKPDRSEVKVEALKGQNLRQVLGGVGVEIYEGKAKMTNCGGGGTCGTCAVLVLNNEFWEKRPKFEGTRLKKYSENARLACNTIIEGDCRVVLNPVKIEQ
jgi:ferredoxin